MYGCFPGTRSQTSTMLGIYIYISLCIYCILEDLDGVRRSDVSYTSVFTFAFPIGCGMVEKHHSRFDAPGPMMAHGMLRSSASS